LILAKATVIFTKKIKMSIEELIKPGLLSVQSKSDEIDAVLSEMEDIPDEVANAIKTAVQKEAYADWVKWGNCWGLIAAATGAGKSKIAIDAAQDVVSAKKTAKILVCVPTEKLRDENWEDEFRKWGLIRLYNKNVERTCHVSMSKIVGQEFDLVIFDEAHNITESNSSFFRQNKIEKCIALSATPPSDSTKKFLLGEANLKTVYTLSLDTAVKLRMVAPYEITVVETRLESTKKTVPGGSKDKPFLNTEKNHYEYLTKTINSLMFNSNRTAQQNAALKFKTINRMHFIYNLESKLEVAKQVIARLPQDERTLIFCANIEQAEKLSPHVFHSKSSDEDLNRFKKGQIHELACVKSLNEGHNIPIKVDNAIIVQLNSNDRNLIQRIGRILRYKKGHVAKVIIILCIDTVDENWYIKATAGLDSSKITRIRFRKEEELVI